MADTADQKAVADTLALLKRRIIERRGDLEKMRSIAVLEGELKLEDTGLLGLVDSALGAMNDMEKKIDNLPLLKTIVAKRKA